MIDEIWALVDKRRSESEEKKLSEYFSKAFTSSSEDRIEALRVKLALMDDMYQDEVEKEIGGLITMFSSLDVENLNPVYLDDLLSCITSLFPFIYDESSTVFHSLSYFEAYVRSVLSGELYELAYYFSGDVHLVDKDLLLSSIRWIKERMSSEFDAEKCLRLGKELEEVLAGTRDSIHFY